MTKAADQISNKIDGELVITRVIDAPRDLVFRAWTDPEHFAQWYGPRGFSIPYCTIDLKVGGKRHFCMRSPNGHDMWLAGEYLEVDPPARIVCTEYSADQDGNLVPPSKLGMPEEWPEKTILTITLEDVAGKTRMTMRQSIPQVLAEKFGALQGWNQAFDRLEAALAGLPQPSSRA